MNNFNDELNNFRIHLPGGDEISIADEAAVLKLFESQNPDWSTAGHVTSIPIARVPRVFLQNSEMTKNFVDRYSSLQTGEFGEIDTYEKLLSLKNMNQVGGTLIFPNVDGNHFNSPEAKVEIDFVVIDSQKGVIVISVKNSTLVKKMNHVKDMEKHTKFIRLLRDFSQCNAPVPPVHGLICSLKSDVNVDKLQREGFWKLSDSHEKRFVFQPKDMINFLPAWERMLGEMPNLDQNQASNLSKLASKLAILNSMEGTLSFLHEKVESNAIQEIKLKKSEASKMIEEAVSMSAASQNLDVAEVSALMQQVPASSATSSCNQKNKKSYFLWTNDQLNVICQIIAELKQHKPTTKGCRILVAGPKGSGKTMLLLYVAELAKLVLAPDEKNMQPKIVVCDGRLGSTQILFEKLKKQLSNKNIFVYSELFGSETLLNYYDLVLVDEYVHNLGSGHISKFSRSQHVIIFTSDIATISPKTQLLPSFQILNLSCSLRSTVELASFAEDFRNMDTENQLMSVRSGHNYRGPEPTVKILDFDSTQDPEQTRFAEEASKYIKQVVLESRGLKSILAVPYVHAITLSRVLTQLANDKIYYEYKNPGDFYSKSRHLCEDEENPENNHSTSGNYPVVTFVTGNHVDGAEYGSVVVLLERSLPHFWHNFLFLNLFIAFTRATTKLVIVVNNVTEAPVVGCNLSLPSEENAPSFWHMVGPNFDPQYAYSWIRTDMSNLARKVVAILEKKFRSPYPIILFGTNPRIQGMIEIDPPIQSDPAANLSARKLKWLRLPNENTVVLLRNDNHLLYLGTSDFHQEFCALIFVICSENDFLKTVNLIERHRLLYFMHERQLGFSPIYLVTTFDIKRSALDTHKICKFLSKKGQTVEIFDNQLQETSQKLTKTASNHQQKKEKREGQHKHQFKFDKIPNSELFGKSSQKENTSDLTRSFDLLNIKYKNQLNCSKIEELCTMRMNLADLVGKLAYCHYLRSVEQNNLDEKNLSLAIDFFSKAQDLNPISMIEHFEHYKKCLNLLSKDAKILKKVDNQEKEARHILKVGTQKKKIEEAVIQDKIKGSPCYNLIKFKSDCMLLDKSEKCCHHSVFGAILAAYLARKKQVSLLMNPGVYEELWPVALGTLPRLQSLFLPCELDIVGNWTPEDKNSSNKWITKDPPIVIQNVIQNFPGHNYTFNLLAGTIYLTRVSVKNWQPFQTAAIYSGFNSVVHAKQCSFMSKCGAAISLHDDSEVTLEKCRFVDTYGAVLLTSGETIGKVFNVQAGESKLHISDSLINKTKVIGIELRANVSALIENCRIQNCSKRAISGIFGSSITIRDCFFEANSFKATVDDGAIYLHRCKTSILSSAIRHQPGHGIVAEYGQSIFNKVSISDCKSGAILVAGECSVSHCDFQHCRFGMVIGRTGVLRMSSNKITQCNAKFARLPGSKAPINMDTNLEETESTIQGSNEPWEIENYASMIFEKRAKIREELQKKRTELGDVLGVEQPFSLSCGFCTVDDYERRSQYILCPRCETTVFCSKTCLEKSEVVHKPDCDWTTDVLEKLREIKSSELGKQKRAESLQQSSRTTEKTESEKLVPGRRKNRRNAKKK
ncbi:uncharacterized protein LOC134844590 [Symsagittifera roscoffensis]|uniref:uncharacterized protein LOC134844590 n=1 Tax=Symsagittifera roscoffensis TaxID=84072 RepID=UPI00307C2266